MELPTTLETKERAPEFRRRSLAVNGQFQNVLGNLMEAASIQVQATTPAEILSTRREETEKPSDEQVPETERPEEEDNLSDADDVLTYQQAKPADVEKLKFAAAVVSTEKEANTATASEVQNYTGQTDAPAEALAGAVESDEALIDSQPELVEQIADESGDESKIDSELPPEIEQTSTNTTEVEQVGPPSGVTGGQPTDSPPEQPTPGRASSQLENTKEQSHVEPTKSAELKPAVEQAEVVKPDSKAEAAPTTIKAQDVESSANGLQAQTVDASKAVKPELLERYAGKADSPEQTVVKGTESAPVIPEGQPVALAEMPISQMLPVTAMAVSAVPMAVNQAPQLTVQGSQAVARAQNTEQAVLIKEVAAAEKSRVDVNRANAASRPESARNIGSRQIEIIRQVAKNIALRGATKNTEVRLALSPPNLGTVKLTISINEGVMSGSIVTESQSIRHMLQQQIPELREALAQDGIQLENLDVSTDENQQQANTQQRPHQQANSPQRPQITSATTETKNETRPEAATVNDGRVQGYM
ncbi:MAG: flagellar hook-length control protein FliK [Planctomycetes bacterium]|nr:flagellar hook-length control protein FliK [Planctomycetota bacterium]